MALSESSDHVLLTFGCDFAFTNAEIDYYYLDKVMELWNNHYPHAQMKYSSPTKYLAEIKKMNELFKI